MNNTFNNNGYEHITALIGEAVADGSRTATVTGKYRIDKAVRLPSNFTLILEDCHLRLADGSYTNIFVNEHHDTDIGRTPEGVDVNINIVGRGEAILDGGEYNGLSERNSEKDGMPPIWKNSFVLFTNVDGFCVKNLYCRNQRWWSLNFIYSRNGYIGNIDFCASDVGIDESGNAYHGLIRSRYEQTLVKNADGVDIRQGCHDIVIENITGFTEDDTIAITGLNGRLEQHFRVDGLCSDIADVTVRNIRSSAFCTIVRMLNQGGIKLHDITVDGVYDTSESNDYFDTGLYAVRIGDVRLYGERHATKDETYNIAVRNVYGNGEYAVSLAGDMRDFTMYGIECAKGTRMLLDERNTAEKT